MSTRSERAQRRAKKIRNQRIALIAALVVILGVAGYFAFNAFTQSKATPTPVAASANGMPDLNDLTTAGGGLDYKDLVVGTGAEAKPGMSATVNYTGWLRSNGQKFDSSLDSGQPFTFALGAGQVIQGWDKGVAGMKVGGKRILVIPPELGYGATGAGGVIPPNATLVFVVDLLDVK